MHKKLALVCLINFFIAALMGLLLRFSFISDIYLNYRFLTHAHSHVAMLGWVYLMLYTFYVHYFIPEKKPAYNRLFWLTEFAVIGMMISFPIQGYGAVSISFSTLHILCSYYFAYLIWKNIKSDSLVTSYLVRTSLLFMLLSTIGVWCLGPAVSMLGQASAFYQIAIQFFLHFQFNGWFLIAVIAILFHLLHIEDSKTFRRFFYLLIVSTILTMALPIQWFAPHNSLVWINGLGVFLQLGTLFLLFKLVNPRLWGFFNKNSRLTRNLFRFAFFCLVLKIGLQFSSLIPGFSQVVYEHRNLVIGFIHLTMLGVVSGFLFAFILENNIVTYSRSLQFGIYIFILGFLLTEFIITLQGYFYYIGKGLINHYYTLLFASSILLPLGILLVILNLRIKAKSYSI